MYVFAHILLFAICGLVSGGCLGAVLTLANRFIMRHHVVLGTEAIPASENTALLVQSGFWAHTVLLLSIAEAKPIEVGPCHPLLRRK